MPETTYLDRGTRKYAQAPETTYLDHAHEPDTDSSSDAPARISKSPSCSRNHCTTTYPQNCRSQHLWLPLFGVQPRPHIVCILSPPTHASPAAYCILARGGVETAQRQPTRIYSQGATCVLRVSALVPDSEAEAEPVPRNALRAVRGSPGHHGANVPSPMRAAEPPSPEVLERHWRSTPRHHPPRAVCTYISTPHTPHPDTTPQPAPIAVPPPSFAARDAPLGARCSTTGKINNQHGTRNSNLRKGEGKKRRWNVRE